MALCFDANDAATLAERLAAAKAGIIGRVPCPLEALAAKASAAGRLGVVALELLRRQRLREEMTLSELDTGHREDRRLVLLLDAFCDHLDVRRSEQRGEAVEPLRARSIGTELRNELPIDLDEVEMAAHCRAHSGAAR